MTGFTLGPALLFCPADRPDRYAKALERADAVILDLEDAVAPENRGAAREAIAAADLDPERVIVRVNELGSPDFDADLAALGATSFRLLMVPKADAGLIGRVPEGFSAVALCESAAGVVAAPALAASDRVVALMWGAEDLVASLGGTSSRHADGSYRDVARTARAHVLLAAGAAGIPAIDTVHLDIDDLDGLRAEAEDATASGFSATACIHPSHAAVIRDAYRPTAERVEWARRVLDAAAEHASDGHGGVFRFEGGMVDGPVLRHAEAVVRRSG
jgi:citrate lyase subunit beta/citryl-CoA lyase